jgi:hypothetical protein
MKRSAFLINIARGRCVNESALIEALRARRIAGAGIDVTAEETLAASSQLWDVETAFITPHTAGETRHYEHNVLDILVGNLDRLWRGEPIRFARLLSMGEPISHGFREANPHTPISNCGSSVRLPRTVTPPPAQVSHGNSPLGGAVRTLHYTCLAGV